VQVVFISVDPGRDTSEGMQEYAERFNPNFIGLSGTLTELEPIWSGYGVYREWWKAHRRPTTSSITPPESH
jgi:protein SCO1